MEYLRLLWPETGLHTVVASRNIAPMLRRLCFIFLIKKAGLYSGPVKEF